MNHQIIQAVANQNLIQFHYDGGVRIVEPHCYGLTTKGNEGLRAYQVDGYSSTGKMGWKMFDLANATSLVILEDRFENPRNDYKKGDKGMSVIYREI